MTDDKNHPSDLGHHRIFDRALSRTRLLRALRMGSGQFLLAQISNELVERLDQILRSFERILDLGTPGPDLAERLVRFAPDRRLIRAAPLKETLGHGPWTGLVVDEEALPFRAGSFGLVASVLAFHTVNDLPGVLAQIRRILRPDGLLLAGFLGGRTLQELRFALQVAEAEIDGGASPRVSPFADVRDLGGLLQRAGFALPVADVDTLTARYDNLFGLVRDLRAMGATNSLIQRRRVPARKALFMRAAEIYGDRFSDPDGRVRATFEIVWVSGWAPHESQQKPLKRGSAAVRLEDVLGRQTLPSDETKK